MHNQHVTFATKVISSSRRGFIGKFLTLNSDIAQTFSLLSLVGFNLFSRGIWAEIQEEATSSGSAHLIHLVDVLKRTTLAAKASGTVLNYSNSLKHWIEFSKDRNLVPFPATVVDIALK